MCLRSRIASGAVILWKNRLIYYVFPSDAPGTVGSSNYHPGFSGDYPMSEAKGVTETLAQWLCAEAHEKLPTEVRKKAVDVILDSVGGMVACSLLPEAKAIAEFVLQH